MSIRLSPLFCCAMLLCTALSGCADRRFTQSAPPPVEPSSVEAPEASAPSEAPVSSPQSEEASVEVDWRLVLVNPSHPLTEDFPATLAMTPYDYEVDERIVDPLVEMIDAASAAGVSLIPCYGYRTLAQSAQLFEKQVGRQLSLGLSQDQAVAEAKKWVAPPGTSDHHTGLALDIVTPEHQVLNHAFSETPAAKWMAANAPEYGFVIRFPEDKQDITGITYEPWHLRYVGEEHALAMVRDNLCLEEYWENYYGEDN